jgi:hypothetical protein
MLYKKTIIIYASRFHPSEDMCFQSFQNLLINQAVRPCCFSISAVFFSSQASGFGPLIERGSEDFNIGSSVKQSIGIFFPSSACFFSSGFGPSKETYFKLV